MKRSHENLSGLPVNRRHFLQSNLSMALAWSVAPWVARRSVLGAGAPNSRIQVGCIGTGPQGRSVLGGFLAQADAQVVAVCDVKDDQLALARKQVNDRYSTADCATVHDFRELLGRGDIDAVLVATPDHWHVPVAAAAARAGKDIYLEKPMGLAIAEDKHLRQAVRQHARVFQFGTQQRSSREFLQACALVRSGRIGALRSIRVWAPASRPGGSTTPAPVPPGLDYNFWLGPARFTAHTAGKCAADDSKTWWYNYDYALGFIAGWGVHPLDIALWGHPELAHGQIGVEGRAVFPKEGACNTAVAWDVRYRAADGVTLEYRGTANQNAVADASPAMSDLSVWRQRYGEIDGHGTAFEGTDGWVLVSRGRLRTSPESLAEQRIDPAAAGLSRSAHHGRNFFDAVRSRQPAICSIDDAFRADVLCHLADLATRLPRPLRWDFAREEFVDDAEANQRAGLRPMRKPWQLLS